MVKCKKCNATQITKSGKANNKQRYHCKSCGYHFTEGDGRTNEQVAVKKAMSVIMRSLGNAPYRKMADIFETSQSLIYNWIVAAGCDQHTQATRGEMKNVPFDNLCSFIKANGAGFEKSKQFTVVSGELLPGCPAIVILQHAGSPAKKTSSGRKTPTA